MVFCRNCGQSWPQHPATVVPCSQCQQPAGSPCRRPSGHELPKGEVHTPREQAAVDAGLLPICPATVVADPPVIEPVQPAAKPLPTPSRRAPDISPRQLDLFTPRPAEATPPQLDLFTLPRQAA